MVRKALLLALSISCFNSKKFEMGCECGLRELSKEEVEMCAESAKLEDQEEYINHLKLLRNFHGFKFKPVFDCGAFFLLLFWKVLHSKDFVQRPD